MGSSLIEYFSLSRAPSSCVVFFESVFCEGSPWKGCRKRLDKVAGRGWSGKTKEDKDLFLGSGGVGVFDAKGWGVPGSFAWISQTFGGVQKPCHKNIWSLVRSLVVWTVRNPHVFSRLDII